jgi:hypothetical protein
MYFGVHIPSPALIYISEDIFFFHMNNTWNKFNTWAHVKKMLFLIFAVVVFFPILYCVILPIIGAVASIVLFFVFLIVISFLIRIWAKGKI